MYFTDRTEAGQRLAQAIDGRLPTVNRSVIALSDGSVLVGEQIAKAVHASLLLLSVEPITLPGELSPMAAVSQAGNMTYNSAYSAGEISEFTMEYNSYIQEERRRKMFKLNRDSSDLQIPPGLLRRHVVILVADGLSDSFIIDAAADFLKPYKINQLVIATPFATVKAIDRMHVVGDQVYCLDVIDNFISTNHYYDNNDIPPHDQIVRDIHLVTLKWAHPVTAER